MRAVYSDNNNDDKRKIFDRLEMPSTSNKTTSSSASDCHEPIIKITGLHKSMSSVFGRLGGKDTLNDEEDDALVEQSRSFSGILKNSASVKATAPGGGIVKKVVKTQKVILVKKQPAKAVTMNATVAKVTARDNYLDGRTAESGGEKSVSFSSEDEILEIAPRPKSVAPATKTIVQQVRPKRMLPSVNVKDRLGFKTNKSMNGTVNATDSLLHRTRKIVTLKPNAAGRKLTSPKMQSDIMTNRRISVKSRLCLDDSSSTTNPIRQMARLSLKKTTTTTPPSRIAKSSSSVFQRLGFTD